MSCQDIFRNPDNISCYWAGFLAADGWINNTNYVIGCKLSAQDKDHIQKLAHALSSYNKITINNSVCCIQIAGAGDAIISLHNHFNITAAKSITLEPPQLNIEIQIRNFIRGYFDGDGYLSKTSNGYIQIGFAGTPMMLNWIKSNIQTNVSVGDPAVSKHGIDNIYQLIFGGKQANRILDWLYTESTSAIRLDRKYNKYQELLLWSR